MIVAFHERERKFILQTEHTAYCLGIDADGNIQHLYWGSPLMRIGDYPDCAPIGESTIPPQLNPDGYFYPFEIGRAVINEEYPGWGGLTYAEPCLKASFADGVRDLVLGYTEHRIEGNTLTITLQDAHYALRVHLYYRVLADVDCIVRWAVIENGSDQAVRLESVQSAGWHVPNQRRYRLTSLSGRWGGEFNPQHSMLEQGKVVLESRRGLTSHHATPWFALDPNGASTEQVGETWFGTLAWSGNWKIVAEVTSNEQTRVIAGINDFDFAWMLGPGETFTAPECIGGYTDQGFGGASRSLHRYGLRYAYPEAHRGEPWPVFYNTWETFQFDIDETRLMALAEKAAALGVEVFHVDDGWFGTRNTDRSGLGDWVVNTTKFPNGLLPVVEKVEALGMKFSLWIEPENVNEDSDLYRAHPDWVYLFPTRTPSLQRDSLVLDLGRADVQAHVWAVIAGLVREYRVKHFKWDMNRQISEPGSKHVQEMWVRHVQGVYAIKERLRREFPDVTLECCAGGGGRIDYGMLRFCETALVSDDHDPFFRLLAHEGYSYAFPAKTMGSWVTDMPSPLTGRSVPLPFIFHMAMMGTMGLMNNILEWDVHETADAREMIALYKRLRPLIQEGDQYRLSSLRTEHVGAVQYVDAAQGQSVILTFMRTHPAKPLPPANLIRWARPQFSFRLYAQGLDAGRLYQVEGEEHPRSGASLMHAGILVMFTGDYDSKLIRIEARSIGNG